MSASNINVSGVGKQKFIFVNRYFYPDHSASSQILSDLAFYLAAAGENVHVISSRQRYENPTAQLPAQETVSGVQVHRVQTTHFGRHSYCGRALDYASFYIACTIALLRNTQRDDVVIAKTDPPMLSVMSSALAWWRCYKTVNWLQDIYPEIAIELGISGVNGILGKLLIALRNASLRYASVNVVVGEDMANHVLRLGIQPTRLKIVHNWTNDEQIIPSDSGTNELRSKWSLEGKFIVAYSGNLGRAHDIETLVGAATRLRDRRDIAFLIIGEGHAARDLRSLVEERKLSNFYFQPYQAREVLPSSLGVADVHWVSLKPCLDGLVLPSKFYGIAAAGRPMLIVGSPNGELAKLVARYDCGISVPMGMEEKLAEAILMLSDNPARSRRLGANAREMLDKNFQRSAALERWHTILRSLISKIPS